MVSMDVVCLCVSPSSATPPSIGSLGFADSPMGRFGLLGVVESYRIERALDAGYKVFRFHVSSQT